MEVNGGIVPIVDDDRIFIFGWSIPLIKSEVCAFPKHITCTPVSKVPKFRIYLSLNAV